MIEKVLHPKNLYKACHQVVCNKGSAGIDGMQVGELKSFIDNNRITVVISILNRKYVPQAIKGVEIPKRNGKTRLLGVPTVVDRWLQQAVSQQLTTKFEFDFEEQSYGFRPERNLHGAVKQSLKNINDGYQDIVDIDLKGFFDEVQHYKLLQLIYNKVKCPTTLWLIRKWLRAPIRINGKLHKRRKGMPQGSPFSPHTHPQTLSLVGGYRLKEGSFNFGFITKSIFFMINGKITESRIGKTHQSYVCFAEKRQASISGNIALDGKIWCIPDTGLSLCSASQGDQWENGYTGNFCSVYGKNTTRPDQPGKKVCKFQRNDYQQSSQGSIGGIFVKERSWPNKRGKLKYPSVMTVCGSKSSLRFTIYLCQPIAKLFQLNNLAMN